MKAEPGEVRSVTKADLPRLLAWRNHPSVRSYMYSQHEITEMEHQKWFERVLADEQRHLLVYSEHQLPVGFAQLAVTDQRADWGFYLSPDASKGTGTRLGFKVLDKAFFELQLHKVVGEALDFNQASIAFHQKLGFVNEGRLRDQVRINQMYHDVLCFGLLASEWRQIRDRV